MHELYDTNLAKVYDEIYQGFIDYPQEYKFYKNICQRYGASNILEIACGTGNLTPFFIKTKWRFLKQRLETPTKRLGVS